MNDKPTYNPNAGKGPGKGLPQRKSIRLKGYDYSQAGLYFITICCQNRICLFGEVVKGQMMLNLAGQMIHTEWLNLPDRFKNIELHESVIMPNHFHGILEIVDPVRPTVATNVSPSIGTTISPSIAPTVSATIGTTVGATLVVAGNDDNSENQIGQPQGIAEITENQIGQPQGIAPTKTVGDMMDAYKSITTVEYIRGVKILGWQPFLGKLWQRNYWEHIIRDEQSYQRISNYIINNPEKWTDDKFYKS